MLLGFGSLGDQALGDVAPVISTTPVVAYMIAALESGPAVQSNARIASEIGATVKPSSDVLMEGIAGALASKIFVTENMIKASRAEDAQIESLARMAASGSIDTEILRGVPSSMLTAGEFTLGVKGRCAAPLELIGIALVNISGILQLEILSTTIVVRGAASAIEIGSFQVASHTVRIEESDVVRAGSSFRAEITKAIRNQTTADIEIIVQSVTNAMNVLEILKTYQHLVKGVVQIERGHATVEVVWGKEYRELLRRNRGDDP